MAPISQTIFLMYYFVYYYFIIFIQILSKFIPADQTDNKSELVG